MRSRAITLFTFPILFALAGSPPMAQNKEPLALRDMGSFHIGGRLAEISGKPVREVSIGGATQKLDPNGSYLVEQDVCAICPAAEPQRQSAALDVARRRLHRRDL